MTVAPAGLELAAERIAAASETAFVAAVSGPANLHATVICRDTRALYAFLVREVGALPDVHTVETSPVVRHVKQAGSLLHGARLHDGG